MNHIFGTVDKNGRIVEGLKTIGEEHTNYTGQTTIKREFDDCVITDTFTITDHYRTEESNGLFYDWYTIANHSRSTDTYAADKENVAEEIDAGDTATAELAELVATHEEAIAELAELIATLQA